jgi:hypothetical protein
MPLETFVGQKLITEDGLNGLPVRLYNSNGTAVTVSGSTTIQTSQTFSATGAAAGTIAAGTWYEMALELNVTAISGTTPSDTVSIQFSPDGGITWCTIASFAPATATGTYYLALGTGSQRPFGLLIRAFHTITGTTPSITCAILAGVK